MNRSKTYSKVCHTQYEFFVDELTTEGYEFIDEDVIESAIHIRKGMHGDEATSKRSVEIHQLDLSKLTLLDSVAKIVQVEVCRSRRFYSVNRSFKANMIRAQNLH
ncbi:hypothetical protein [Pseudothermotoga sp.]|nr:hypothetical protein [Pseudothermotoga sp.]MDW8140577.1 hypothetical protein [Pseudothermotoga sp.]